MVEQKARNVISHLKQKWNLQNTVAYVILSLAITVFASVLIFKFVFEHWFILPVIFIIVIFCACLLFVKKIVEHDIITFLNKAFPEDFEESSHLFLQPVSTLNMVEQLQLNKIENKLSRDLPTPPLIKRRIKTSSILLVLAILISIVILKIPVKAVYNLGTDETSHTITNTGKPEIKLPQVEKLELQIVPPTYTHKSVRTQDGFNVTTEQNAVVKWTISTNIHAKNVDLIFNDKSVLHLQSIQKNNTKWTGSKQVTNAGFYQLRIENNLSELYQVEMVKDQPPVIVVQSPKPNTVIEYGQPQKVLINVGVTDDYGVDSTFINATTASGSGEAVKFKEQRIAFANFKAGKTQYALQKQVDLAALEMQPGDELYFYIIAKDNFKQEKRSDVFIVRLEDTAQLLSMNGLVSGVDVKPEFFRSERQIIIETEQLIKDRDTISVENFSKKSTDLGVDQKLLRMRYGKFLGEENETEIGEDHNQSSAGNNASDFNNADKILDQYSHKHDIAEDATFFDAQTKKQLLATLSEMWKAELQLRTLKPKEALPFEYKALRLLKDLQQSTRAYVSKTGTKTTPLKPEIRLTGDLTKIASPVVTENFQQKADATTTLRKALGILEQLRNKEALPTSAIEILQQSSEQLAGYAASNPAVYLAALQATRRILNKHFLVKDIDLAGNAFQKMIKSVPQDPQKFAAPADMKLSQRYFMNLNRQHD